MNPNRIQRLKSPNAHTKKGSVPWNKGKINTHSAWNKGKIGLPGCVHTDETKSRLSEIAKNRGLGGYVKGSGAGKKGWYKGIFCDSSWELAYVVYCLDHNIDIKRNTQKFPYMWNGVSKNYIPDFIVNGVLAEIKGYVTDQWLEKLKTYPDIIVLYEKELLPILKYVKSKYGNNFLSLYE